MTEKLQLPSILPVESIIKLVESNSTSEQIEIWIPDRLTLNGKDIRRDIGFAILIDKILEHGFDVGDIRKEIGGGFYKYLKRLQN